MQRCLWIFLFLYILPFEDIFGSLMALDRASCEFGFLLLFCISSGYLDTLGNFGRVYSRLWRIWLVDMHTDFLHHHSRLLRRFVCSPSRSNHSGTSAVSAAFRRAGLVSLREPLFSPLARRDFSLHDLPTSCLPDLLSVANGWEQKAAIETPTSTLPTTMPSATAL